MSSTMELPVMVEGPSMAKLGWSKLPAGKYAMPNKVTQRVHFFSVSYGKPGGRWDGYTFVEEHQGPNRRKVRDRDERMGILRALERNPLGCIRLFAQQTNTCSFCGKELTNPRARGNGYGKDCGDKHGLPW